MDKMDTKIHVLAFYLPQYYPVKENDEWFGEGFTEWTNVASSKPLFKGHIQPKIPSSLGFYDLRLNAVREKQAELAREAGISAFFYYHYWFGNGRVILEKPLDMLIHSPKPDFPFCLCWANHSWKRKNWNPRSNTLEENLLIEQTYPGEKDIVDHFNYLLPAFKDPRYYRIDGRLVFSIYDSMGFPDFQLLKSIWNRLAVENGLPEFFFIGYTSIVENLDKTRLLEYDCAMLSLITNIQFHQDYSLFSRAKNKLKEKVSELTNKPLLVYEYKDVLPLLLDKSCLKDRNIPVIFPNWDYTPRRGAGGLILVNSTPELFKKHAKEAIQMVSAKPSKYRILVVKSWNEWGEGNYMEPDLLYGKGYINALKESLQ